MTSCSKTPYTQARAYELKRRREHENRSLVLRVYFCGVCGHWHLTSQPDRFRKESA